MLNAYDTVTDKVVIVSLYEKMNKIKLRKTALPLPPIITTQTNSMTCKTHLARTPLLSLPLQVEQSSNGASLITAHEEKILFSIFGFELDENWLKNTSKPSS